MRHGHMARRDQGADRGVPLLHGGATGMSERLAHQNPTPYLTLIHLTCMALGKESHPCQTIWPCVRSTFPGGMTLTLDIGFAVFPPLWETTQG